MLCEAAQGQIPARSTHLPSIWTLKKPKKKQVPSEENKGSKIPIRGCGLALPPHTHTHWQSAQERRKSKGMRIEMGLTSFQQSHNHRPESCYMPPCQPTVASKGSTTIKQTVFPLVFFFPFKGREKENQKEDGKEEKRGRQVEEGMKKKGAKHLLVLIPAGLSGPPPSPQLHKNHVMSN